MRGCRAVFEDGSPGVWPVPGSGGSLIPDERTEDGDNERAADDHSASTVLAGACVGEDAEGHTAERGHDTTMASTTPPVNSLSDPGIRVVAPACLQPSAVADRAIRHSARASLGRAIPADMHDDAVVFNRFIASFRVLPHRKSFGMAWLDS